VTRLNTETAIAMRAPEMRERLAAEGADPLSGSVAELTALLKAEIATWARVVQLAGITPE
jgi:tripartite-type tricarboxylate transporter receptor subunit TctC